MTDNVNPQLAEHLSRIDVDLSKSYVSAMQPHEGVAKINQFIEECRQFHPEGDMLFEFVVCAVYEDSKEPHAIFVIPTPTLDKSEQPRIRVYPQALQKIQNAIIEQKQTGVVEEQKDFYARLEKQVGEAVRNMECCLKAMPLGLEKKLA